MFEKILLAVDGSEHSDQATAAASGIATKSDRPWAANCWSLPAPPRAANFRA